ncbi:hypothetical protein Taro_020285 [Colocasia esculenta]|uniref:Large ribosomal RNA subunit accumulation protein YCED homolog 1, chloroplastic n=1 Tax=Colocasia esculenta TaxID=4460 RepID=A0A843V1N2_COLES|nr:hypothetical protein [Colocasia esculenta]
MALVFSLPPASSCTIPSRSPSLLPALKPSRLLPTHLFCERISSLQCCWTLRAPVLASSPASPLLSRIKAPTFLTSVAAGASSGFYFSETADDLGFDVEDEEDGEGSPWEEAVVYRRDASVTHLECCTTLERLGMGRLSTELSRSRAAAMGIRLVPNRKGTTAGDAFLSGTPVLVSIDVTRKKRKLKLDGIVRTVITLGCNRCAEPAAESVFSNFSLLLTEEPVEEPEQINMGVIYGEDKSRAASMSEGQEDDDELEIDPDDRLYFPAKEKEIDLSKHIRDIVHVEIAINVVCDAGCKGLCLKCGTNLNKSSCTCSKAGAGQRKEYGPLATLKKKMQQR